MKIRRNLPAKFPRRLIMCITGVFFCSFAVGFFKCSLFGVDPFQCFSMGSWGLISGQISYGLYYSLLNLAFLLAVLILDKHYVGLATFINLFLTGYIADWAWTLISAWVPAPGFSGRLLLLAIGIVLMCFAASMYMTADLGVSVYDALPIIISNRSGKQFRLVRICTDTILVIIGTICVLCGGEGGQLPGLGTIISALFMGPLIDFFNRKVSRPLLKKNF